MRNQNSWLQWIYLCLAIAGAILPALANIEFMQLYGPAFNIQLFIELENTNPDAQSL